MGSPPTTQTNIVHTKSQSPRSVLNVFQVPIKVLVGAERQELDRVFIHAPVGQQAQLVIHPELVDTDTSQIADLGFTDAWLLRYRPYSPIKIQLLRFMQLLECPLKRGRE